MNDFQVVAEQCKMAYMCRNSVEIAGDRRQKCSVCRLSPPNVGYSTDYWSPIDYRAKHPQLEFESKRRRAEKLKQRRLERKNKDRNRQQVLSRSARAERQTEQSIIKATKNSGRSRRDGDHVAAMTISLDTKQQSQRNNPVVQMHELAKIREDAARAGYSIGALVLRNASNVGVVAIHEKDFAIILELINERAPQSGCSEGTDQDLSTSVPGEERSPSQ
jgi:hypothetical protein